MAARGFTKGLHDLGNGCFAWLQPNGGWGYSNSGLVVDSGQSMIVDTLYDLPKTREMLAAYRAAAPAIRNFDIVLNSHANGDHTYGNQLVAGARIIATRAAAEDMAARRPEERTQLMRDWRTRGAYGEWAHETYARDFDFEGLVYTPATESFEKEMTFRVGTKEVHLVNVGPAHTRGDMLAYVPADRVVYTGDIVFADVHPAIWAGPIANWIAACDLMLGWDIETVVPGHGPLTDKNGVRQLREYFVYIAAETRRRFDAGMSEAEAAIDISLDAFRGWADPERIVINVSTLYAEFSGGRHRTKPEDLYTRLRRYTREAKARR